MNDQFGIIFNIRLEGYPPVERTRFNRKFLGYTDKSQNGKYSYSRQGFISNILHVHVSNSLFIIMESDLATVKDFCKTYGLSLFTRKVELTPSDMEVLLR